MKSHLTIYCPLCNQMCKEHDSISIKEPYYTCFKLHSTDVYIDIPHAFAIFYDNDYSLTYRIIENENYLYTDYAVRKSKDKDKCTLFFIKSANVKEAVSFDIKDFEYKDAWFVLQDLVNRFDQLKSFI